VGGTLEKSSTREAVVVVLSKLATCRRLLRTAQLTWQTAPHGKVTALSAWSWSYARCASSTEQNDTYANATDPVSWLSIFKSTCDTLSNTACLGRGGIGAE